jgi:hypothetical protein
VIGTRPPVAKVMFSIAMVAMSLATGVKYSSEW